MRGNLKTSSPMEPLSLNGFQRPYDNVTEDQKRVFVSVSSNVYYGYQPLRVENDRESQPEPMVTEDLKKSTSSMDTNQCESSLISRKRTRDCTESNLQVWKKRRQNEPLRSVPGLQRFASTKTCLDEDLLRETHGCSYYHWISSSSV